MATPERYQVSPRTLTFLVNGNDVLLIHRSPERRLFPGKWNGIGGHIERGENIYAAALREVREETGLTPSHLRLVCILHVDEGNEKPGVLVFIFVGQSASRSLTASAEGDLHWVTMDQLPELDILDDVRVLLPRILDAGAPLLFARSVMDESNAVHLLEITPTSAEQTKGESASS